MKLAEALLIRADHKKKLASLRERIAKNARVQEGEEPQEKVSALIEESFAVLQEQQAIVQKIDIVNMRDKLPDGRLLADEHSERETLIQQHSLLVSAISSTQKEGDRYSPREIKWVVQINVSAIQKQADDISVKIRVLNARIQETNWLTEL